MTVSFAVPGIPVAQGRPRACVRGGHAAVYQPKASAEWRAVARLAAAEAMGGNPPIPGAVSLACTFLFPWPKSMSKRARLAAASRGKGTKPDIDNLLKAVMDACNGVAWEDDARVSAVSASKGYADAPRTEVSICGL